MLYELLHYQLLQLSIGAVANDGQTALHLYAVSMAEEGFRPPINPKLPQGLQDLIKACWAQQPEDRPSMAVVLQQLRTLQQVIRFCSAGCAQLVWLGFDLELLPVHIIVTLYMRCRG